jgi:hypothetical protein
MELFKKIKKIKLILLLCNFYLYYINGLDINNNIGVISSCYEILSNDNTCITLFLPSNYFIVKKKCFSKLLNENKSMYVHYNGIANIIYYMIEYNDNYYLKTNYNIYNFTLLKDITYINTLKFNFLSDIKNNIYTISYINNIFLNISKLNNDSYIYNDISFQHNLYNNKINYFNISIYPDNNITFIPDYIKEYDCNLYNFQLNYDYFYDDYCLIN